MQFQVTQLPWNGEHVLIENLIPLFHHTFSYDIKFPLNYFSDSPTKFSSPLTGSELAVKWEKLSTPKCC